MRGVSVLVLLVGALILLWLVVRLVCRLRDQRDAESSRWRIEVWSAAGVTYVGLRRNKEEILVRSIPNDDADWLSKHAQAQEEALQRAVELNAAIPR